MMEKILAFITETMLQFLNDNVDVFTVVFAVIGGAFALKQWRTQIMHKRAEIVKSMLSIVRDDKEIASIMDIIDWDEGICYDGKFSVDSECHKKEFIGVDNDALFKMVDKTLAHFSYICYLKKSHALSKKDFAVFEYGIRRITDNPSICDYLFNIYHWSDYLDVECSFGYLIDYALKRGYLTKDFKSLSSKNYEQYLEIPRKL